MDTRIETLFEPSVNLKRGEKAEIHLCNLLNLQSHSRWTDRFDATDTSGNRYEIKSCRVALPNRGYRYRNGRFKLHDKDLYNDEETKLLFALEYSSGRVEYLGMLTLGEYKKHFGMAKSISWTSISNYVYLRDKKQEPVDDDVKIGDTQQSIIDDFLV